MKDRLTFRLITPDGIMTDCECTAVDMTACADKNGQGGGSVGIRRGHLPAVIALESGSKIKITLQNGDRQTVKVDGGFAEVADNTVTVICEKAEK